MKRKLADFFEGDMELDVAEELAAESLRQVISPHVVDSAAGRLDGLDMSLFCLGLDNGRVYFGFGATEEMAEKHAYIAVYDDYQRNSSVAQEAGEIGIALARERAVN